MSLSTIAYVATATILLFKNTAADDGWDNIICEAGEWNAFGTPQGINVNGCEIQAEDDSSGPSATWLGDPTGTVPGHSIGNFEARLEFNGLPAGGLLFRATDVSQCGEATFGNCGAYFLYLAPDGIGLKGPNGDADGWLVPLQPITYSHGVNGTFPYDWGHYSFRVEVVNDILLVYFNWDEFQFAYNNLQTTEGGIGYRIPTAMNLNIERIEVWDTDGDDSALCRSGLTEFGSANFDTDYADCEWTSGTGTGAGMIWLGDSSGDIAGAKEEFGDFEAEILVSADWGTTRNGFIFGAQAVSDCGDATFGSSTCNAYYLSFGAGDSIKLQGPNGFGAMESVSSVTFASSPMIHIRIEYRTGDLQVYINGEFAWRSDASIYDISGGIGYRVDDSNSVVTVYSLEVHQLDERLLCRGDWAEVGGGDFFTSETTDTDDYWNGCQIRTNNNDSDLLSGVIWLGNIAGDAPSTEYESFHLNYGFYFFEPEGQTMGDSIGGVMFRASDVSNCATDTVTDCDAYFLNFYPNGDTDDGFVELRGPNGLIEMMRLPGPLRASQRIWNELHSWTDEKHYWVNIDLEGEQIEIEIGGDGVDDSYNFEYQVYGLSELSNGGIGYRVTGPAEVVVRGMNLWSNDGYNGEDPFCGNFWTAVTGSIEQTTENDVCVMSVTALGGVNSDVGLIEVDRDVDICDFPITFDVTIPASDTTAGIFLRNAFPGVTGANNMIGYYFGVTTSDPPSYVLGYYDSVDGNIRFADGTTGLDPIQGTTIAVGDPFEITFVAFGTQFTAYVNGIEQATWDDGNDTVACGSAGFMVQGGLAGFSNLRPGYYNVSTGGDGSETLTGVINTCGHAALGWDVMCLEAHNHFGIVQSTCDGYYNPSQYWQYDSNDQTIRMDQDDECWESTDGETIELQGCDYGSSQRWEFTAEGTLRHVDSGKCTVIDSNDFQTAANGADVYLFECEPALQNHEHICFDETPPLDCQVGPWRNNGNICSEECGPNGIIPQTRVEIEAAQNGGGRGLCDQLTQDYPCNTHIQCSNGCKRGQGYSVIGTPATTSGDPHTRTFFGGMHDFMGDSNQISTNQYYYMHPCKYDKQGNEITREDMPFTMLGKHEDLGWGGVTGLGYMTLELYDTNGDTYYVWVNSVLHSYGAATDFSSTLYDDTNPGTDITLGAPKVISNRFTILIEDATGDWGSRAGISVTLTIDGQCYLEFSMWEGPSGQETKMHQVVVQPPVCYRCYTCGLFGDFFSMKNRDRNKGWFVMQTCNGDQVNVTRGSGIPSAYDQNGLGWLKSYADACPVTSRRLQEEVIIQPQTDPNLVITDPCPDGTAEADHAIQGCDLAQVNLEISDPDCCAQMADVCEDLKEGCATDVCVMSLRSSETRFPEEIAADVYASALQNTCSIPGNAEAQDTTNLCALTEWFYSECGGDCDGIGTQTRSRSIDFDGGGTEAACAGATLEETITCVTEDCPDTTTDTPWNPFPSANSDTCPIIDTATFNWDTLTSAGIAIPLVTFEMNVNKDDLTLNIEVEVDYIVNAYADDQVQPNFGTTYVLDFEDFDAHKSSISLPGTCQNRLAVSYANLGSDQYFQITSEDRTDIGTEQNMCYPPSDGTGWSINIDESTCQTIKYEGTWTWNELRNCRNNALESRASNADAEQTFVDDNDLDWLSLSGTFYINMVSPFWNENNDVYGDYYRVYQLVSQPFIIQVSKSVYVIGSTDINVMTMSIIAVYKEDQDTDYALVLLTETAEYMQLADATLVSYSGDQTQFSTLTALSDAETGTANDACLNNKAFICSQLWKVFALETSCDSVTGTVFSGTYQLRFDPQCRQGQGDTVNGVQGYDFNTHCTDWLVKHSDFNPNDDGVVLQSQLTFVDEICDPRIFTVQLGAEMDFSEDDQYTQFIGTDSSHLYQVGVDTVYGQISLTFPSATEDIFESTLVNVWLCTFPPDTTVANPDQNGFNGANAMVSDNGGCFSADRDGFGEANSDFFFHIYSSQQTPALETEDFSLTEDGSVVSDRIRFAFTVPHSIERDTLYVHAQVEVLLEEMGARRRRVLLDVPMGATANKMSHFGQQIGITRNKPKPETPQLPNNEPNPNVYAPQLPNGSVPFTISLSSKWVMVIGGLLSVVLMFNIALMAYMNCKCCRGSRRAVVSFGREGYETVKEIDSEEFESEDFEDSEANLINVNE